MVSSLVTFHVMSCQEIPLFHKCLFPDLRAAIYRNLKVNGVMTQHKLMLVLHTSANIMQFVVIFFHVKFMDWFVAYCAWHRKQMGFPNP